MDYDGFELVIIMDAFQMNTLVLAYLGDTIYEQYVRRYFIEQGISHVKELQNHVIPVVQAKGQAKYLQFLLEENFFTEKELAIIYRARNAKGHAHPKSCDVLTYKHATAMEAVIGYLSMINCFSRVEQIMKKILEEYVC